jgi:choline-sulfatase
MRALLFFGIASHFFGLVVATNATKRMNFVFMFPDTLRAESFSSYGNPLKTSPNLDKFAERGVRFEQAHALHTQCSPSRATMFTGRYMHVLGHRTQQHLIQPYEFNYFQIMKDNGYHVQYYGKNDGFSEDAMNLSVSEWSGDIGTLSGPNAFKYGEAGYYSMLSQGSSSAKDNLLNGDYRAVVKAVDWLKKDAAAKQPFLVFIPGRGAHPPYGSPHEFNNMWSVDDVKKNIKLRPPFNPKKPKYHSGDIGIPHYRNLTTLDEDTFYKIQATYLGMISYTDWIFGELLRGIEESGMSNNTAIFFSSDHGDFGGDYHMVEKWPGAADDVLTRVPVYARVPGASSKAKGFVAKAPIQLFDIPHTICELAGINVTGDGSGQYGINFGKSLVSQLQQGSDTDDDMARFVYSEGGFGFRNEVFPMGSDHVPNDPKGMYYPRAIEEMSDNGNGSPKWVMRRNLTHKLVYRGRGDSELYDFTTDPQELNNLWEDPNYAALKTELMSGLMEWMLQTGDVTPMHTDPRGLPKYPHPASACATGGVVGPTIKQEAARGFDSYFSINNVSDFYGEDWLTSVATVV